MAWPVQPHRLLRADRIRFAFLGMAAAAFVVTEFGRHVYRPYVRQHALRDFGLTDSIGNLGGIVVQIFFCLAVINPIRKHSFRLAGFFAAGFVAYEFVQPYLPKGVFDWKDVLGTLIGLGLSLLVLSVLWRVFPERPGSADSFGQSSGTAG